MGLWPLPFRFATRKYVGGGPFVTHLRKTFQIISEARPHRVGGIGLILTVQVFEHTYTKEALKLSITHE